VRSVKRERRVEEMDDGLSAEVGGFNFQGIRKATSAQKYTNGNDCSLIQTPGNQTF
jgi:hypothetical protein